MVSPRVYRAAFEPRPRRSRAGCDRRVSRWPRGTPLDARNQLGLLDPPGVGHPFVILLTRIRILAAEMTTDEPLGVAVINLIRDLKPRAALDHI